MAGFTRSHGANAQAQDWDDFLADERSQPTGSWLPLDGLDGHYGPGPQLRPTPATRRGPLSPGDVAAESTPTARHNTRTQGQAKAGGKNQAQTVSITGIQVKAVAMLAGAALAALALYVVVSAAVEWLQIRADDFQYGRPRTAQIDAYVGHNETAGVPSHFVAMNLNRRVTVLELPGGDITKINTIVGPYLFGEGEDLTPVRAAVEDVNGDGKPDLVLTVKNEELVYSNDGTQFELMTPEEHAALQKARQQQQAGAAAPEAGK